MSLWGKFWGDWQTPQPEPKIEETEGYKKGFELGKSLADSMNEREKLCRHLCKVIRTLKGYLERQGTDRDEMIQLCEYTLKDAARTLHSDTDSDTKS